MNEQTNLLRRITARPEVFGGKPIIRDMRISVELVLSLLAQGRDVGSHPGRLSGSGAGRHPCLHCLRARGYREGYPVCSDRCRAVRFLVDRCAGRQLADWLREKGYDVVEARDLGPDPGDEALLERANAEHRILVTIDTDFGELVFLHDVAHAGLVRLPDVPAKRRIALMAELIEGHRQVLESGDIVTIRGERIRVSRSPSFKIGGNQ